MVYQVYDSTGHLVRGGFSSYQDAYNWKYVFGNGGYKIRQQ